jgi:hypothetical protein
VNTLRPSRTHRDAESLPHAEIPRGTFAPDEFMPRSVLRDPGFGERIRREAHLRRNEAIRHAIGLLVRWVTVRE